MPPALLSSPDYSPFLPSPRIVFSHPFPLFTRAICITLRFTGTHPLTRVYVRTFIYVPTYVRTCKYSTYKVAMRHELTHTVELRPDQLGPRVFTSLSWRNDNATRHLRRIHQARVQGGRGYGFLFFFSFFSMRECDTLVNPFLFLIVYRAIIVDRRRATFPLVPRPTCCIRANNVT